MRVHKKRRQYPQLFWIHNQSSWPCFDCTVKIQITITEFRFSWWFNYWCWFSSWGLCTARMWSVLPMFRRYVLSPSLGQKRRLSHSIGQADTVLSSKIHILCLVDTQCCLRERERERTPYTETDLQHICSDYWSAYICTYTVDCLGLFWTSGRVGYRFGSLPSALTRARMSLVSCCSHFLSSVWLLNKEWDVVSRLL